MFVFNPGFGCLFLILALIGVILPKFYVTNEHDQRVQVFGFVLFLAVLFFQFPLYIMHKKVIGAVNFCSIDIRQHCLVVIFLYVYLYLYLQLKQWILATSTALLSETHTLLYSTVSLTDRMIIITNKRHTLVVCFLTFALWPTQRCCSVLSFHPSPHFTSEDKDGWGMLQEWMAATSLSKCYISVF